MWPRITVLVRVEEVIQEILVFCVCLHTFFVFKPWNLVSPHVQIKDVCSMTINCHSVCVWYIGDMLVICTSALESTHTQQDYNLGLNETGSRLFLGSLDTKQ